MSRASAHGNAPVQVVVARQPIVDRAGTPVGYELLYRPRTPDAAAVTGEQMTADVVLGALTIGLDQLVGDKAMFCNAERNVLTGQTSVTLPPSRTVIEVLETVVIDEPLLRGCRELADAGYRLALDDFVWTDGIEQLLELATFVKIDFLSTGRDEIVSLVSRCRPYGVQLVAEKVEGPADVAWAHEQGFDLFQGYAIERPVLVHGATLATSVVAHVQLAATLLAEEIDFEELEEILRREPGLVVQLLQMASIGSHHGVRRDVRSVREALVLLGTTRIRQWLALTILAGQPGAAVDALATALTRARATELLASAGGVGAPEVAFTVGLLSSLDLLLAVPLEELERRLEIAEDLKASAFRREGTLGALVADVARYQEALDRGLDPDERTGDLDAAAAAAFAWAMPFVNSLAS